jgi:dihydropteroate synthase
MVGLSRKRFLGHLTGREAAADRDFATSSACAIAIHQGADAIRVHNVRAAYDTARIADAIFSSSVERSTRL